MAANEWVKTGNKWYYTKANGSYATNEWIQDKYYVKVSGEMARNEYVHSNGQIHYVNDKGEKIY